MTKKCTHILAVGGTAALLAGCEHVTGSHPDVRPDPEAVLGQAVRSLEPDEVALLLELVERAERDPRSGTRALPPMGHPLDGLSVEQVRQLFSAAGMPAERYLPPGHPALQADRADQDGAR